MTVKELITELKKLDQDKEICVMGKARSKYSNLGMISEPREIDGIIAEGDWCTFEDGSSEYMVEWYSFILKNASADYPQIKRCGIFSYNKQTNEGALKNEYSNNQG